MKTKTGYLLIADISGYTAYLTTTELDHATPILTSLLGSMVERLGGDLIHLWRLAGDAVLAYTTDEFFPSGETFLTICEDIYNAFARRRLDIHTNTSCPCRACAQVPELDLKILVHHCSFEEVKIGPLLDLSGKGAILVHLMAKTGVREATKIKSYALISQPAFEAMGSPSGLVQYSESMDHFGTVQMHAYDLASAWEKLREARQRIYFEEDEGIWTLRVQLPVPPRVAWQVLVSARGRVKWEEMIEVTVHSEDKRPGPGARIQCIHEMGEFVSWVMDWEPFHYFTSQYQVFFDSTLRHDEIYELRPTEGGCELRFTIGAVFDPERPEARNPEWDEQLLAVYRPAFERWLPLLKANLEKDPSTFA